MGKSRVAPIARSLRANARARGLGRTLRLALHELLFDVRHRTDTGIEVPEHEPANPLIFAELLRRTPVDPRSSTFLDLGAGKGRALILAARHGFARVLGVERSARLCAIAAANAERWNAAHPGAAIELRCADVREAEVPADVDVVFLFDPFPRRLTAAVAAALGESLRRAPRDLHVVYMNPRHASVLAEAGFETVYAQGMDGVVLRARASSDSYRRARKS